MVLLPMVATVSVWSDSSPGCVPDTLSGNAACIPDSRVVAPLRWAFIMSIIDMLGCHLMWNENGILIPFLVNSNYFLLYFK